MNDRKRLSLEEVLSHFEREFSIVRDRFSVHSIPLIAAHQNHEVPVNNPGVYIHWRNDVGVIKVGKSQANSKKRALEHIRHNTKNSQFEMKDLEKDVDARLILFNIGAKKDIHWLLSLEAYMDWNCNPLIPSRRIG